MVKIIFLVILAAITFTGFNLWQDRTKDQPSAYSQVDGTHQFSLDKAASWWVVVNKSRPLKPQSYVPNDLVVPTVTLRSNITTEETKLTFAASEAFKKMVDAASKDGLTITLESGYRSYESQSKLYEYYSNLQQQTELDSYSAKPGYSEHQTGLAVDVGGASNPACNVKACFANTSEATWLKVNAHKYGFIIRYPQAKQDITGYKFEPWHLRYTGIYLATQMKTKNSATLEEYFKLDN